MLCILCLIAQHTFGQNTYKKDSVNLPHNRKLTGITIGTSVAWTTSTLALIDVWYKENFDSGFKFFNDGKEWLQMDKLGHAYTAYHIQSNLHQLYNWADLNDNRSLVYSGLVSLGYLSTFEILDGFSQGYGFSWWDIVANTSGTALYSIQHLIWGEQFIKPKFSFRPTKYAEIRPNILGENYFENLLKDYNGQSYWLTFSPQNWFNNTMVPAWLGLSLGYSIDAKILGDQEHYKHEFSNGTNTTFFAQRQYMLSLDIDFDKIQVKKPWLRTTLKALNHLKVPFPVVQYNTREGIRFYPIYF